MMTWPSDSTTPAETLRHVRRVEILLGALLKRDRHLNIRSAACMRLSLAARFYVSLPTPAPWSGLIHLHAPRTLTPDRTRVLWAATPSPESERHANRNSALGALPTALLRFLADVVRLLSVDDFFRMFPRLDKEFVKQANLGSERAELSSSSTMAHSSAITICLKHRHGFRRGRSVRFGESTKLKTTSRSRKVSRTMCARSSMS